MSHDTQLAIGRNIILGPLDTSLQLVWSHCNWFEDSATRDCPIFNEFPDSKVHGAHMGPIWGGQDPGGPHVGPMYFVTWETLDYMTTYQGCSFRWVFRVTCPIDVHLVASKHWSPAIIFSRYVTWPPLTQFAEYTLFATKSWPNMNYPQLDYWGHICSISTNPMIIDWSILYFLYPVNMVLTLSNEKSRLHMDFRLCIGLLWYKFKHFKQIYTSTDPPRDGLYLINPTCTMTPY